MTIAGMIVLLSENSEEQHAGKDAEQCLNAEQLKIYALGYQEMTGKRADYLMIYNLDAPDGSKNAGEDIKDALILHIFFLNCITSSMIKYDKI